jgi:predicted transposase YdaD
MDTKEKAEQKGTTIPNPHDVFAKEMLSYKKNAVDFFSGILPQKYQENLNLWSIRLDPTIYTDQELDQYFSDVVYNCSYRSGRGRAKLALLFEHKSFVPKFPHSQLLRYILNIWDYHTKQAKARPVVLPVIFYHGRRKRWKQRPLSSYLSGDTELYNRFIPGFEYVLINLRDYPDELITKIFGHNPGVKLWLLIQKYIYTPKMVLEILEKITETDRIFIATEEGLRIWETICRYLFSVTFIKPREIMKTVRPLPPNTKEAMMTTAEWLRQEGLEQGLEQGAFAKAQEDASRMLEEGLDIDLVVRVTGLSREEVEELRQG